MRKMKLSACLLLLLAGSTMQTGSVYGRDAGMAKSNVPLEPVDFGASVSVVQADVTGQDGTVASQVRKYVTEFESRHFKGMTFEQYMPQGTAPGQYDPALCESFSEAYHAAKNVADDITDEAAKTLCDNLDKAFAEMSVEANPVVSGYYYITSGHSGFTSAGKTMAMYATPDNKLMWKAREAQTGFIFKVDELPDGNYSIQNVYTGAYLGAVEGTSTPMVLVETQTVPQVITSLKQQAMFTICNTTNSRHYHTLSHGGGSGIGSSIVTYNGVAGSGSSWLLEPVDDDEVDRLIRLNNGMPRTSTADAPIWYYIQVLGDGNRSNLFMTVEDNGDVHGRAILAPGTEAASRQLWRLEKAGTSYVLVNKATDKYMVLRNDANAVVASVQDGTGYTLTLAKSAYTGYFNLTAQQLPESADAKEIYLHQGNSGYDFAIILVGSAYGTGENSSFAFVSSEALDIEYSDKGDEIWYHVMSAMPDYDGLCICQVADTPAFEVGKAGDGHNGQWKLMKKTDGNVDFVNRATGEAVGTSSSPYGLYNAVNSVVSLDESNGWTMTYVGNGQYLIGGKEEDDIVRYWNVSLASKAPDELNLNRIINSSFAWRLAKVDRTTDVDGVWDAAVARPDVQVCGRRIVVAGTTDYGIYNAAGLLVDADAVLTVGVYLVRIQGQTVKVVVK